MASAGERRADETEQHLAQPAVLRMDPASEYYIGEGCHIIELANTSADADCSIARARVAPGVTTRWHRVAGRAERYVILEGQGRAEVGDLPPQDVNPGDVVLIPGSCPQRIANVGAVDLVFLAVCTPRFRSEAYQDIEDERSGRK